MILVAIAMVAIIAIAALSIDVVTLYLARMEAQRAADAGALAAARVISVSGLTGDPTNSTLNWSFICGGSASTATQAAYAAATQSTVDGASVATPSVMYSAGVAAPVPDCTSSLPASFGVNPLVTVKVTRTNLPTFFSRMWGNTGNTVNATAVAEAFNSSNSDSVTGTTIIPVQPRCVKPWLVPNHDPLNPASPPYCDQAGKPACTAFVNPSDGRVMNKGISLNGGSSNGVIGERFWLSPDCRLNPGSKCTLRTSPPRANYTGNPNVQAPPNLLFVPGQSPAAGPVAVPGCAAGLSFYQQAIAGCDQSTVYQCGVQNMNTVQLNDNPDSDTVAGVQCLIHEGNPSAGQPDGQDTLNPYGAPSSYPFQILAGSSNPLVGGGLPVGNKISASNSIVSVPIYDPVAINATGTTQVTIVGFLQVFINTVDQHGNVDVTVLNVTGCSNGTGPAVGTAVAGSSPVPVRLITGP
jgi:hypothetical protein